MKILGIIPKIVPPMYSNAKDMRTLYPERARRGEFSTAQADTRKAASENIPREVSPSLDRGGGKVVPAGHVHTHGSGTGLTRRAGRKEQKG